MTKTPTPFQIARAKKARTAFMSRSNAALHLMNKRAPHRFSLEKFRVLIADKIGTPCRYCRDIIKAKTFSPDHKQPLSRGGAPTFNNIEIICLKCNHSKGALTAEEYRQLVCLLDEFEDVARNDVLGRLRLGAAAKARWSQRWKR